MKRERDPELARYLASETEDSAAAVPHRQFRVAFTRSRQR
jgi:hypothetical protein